MEGWRGRFLAALFGGILALLFQRGVLGTLPHIADEATYLFEARLLAAGVARAPALDSSLVALTGVRFTTLYQGGWMGGFLPGWPLVLAVFWLAGIPWLVTPLLLVVNIWLIGIWSARHFGEEVAGWTCWLAAFSPALIPIHGSLMADPMALTCLLGAVLLFEKDHWFAAGTAASAAILTRPAALFFVTGALVAEVVLRWAGPHRVKVRQGICFLLGGVPGFGLLLLWNFAATGSAWISPYSLAAPAAFQGAAVYEGLVIHHDLVAAGINLWMNTVAMAVDLLGWPGLAWLPVVLGAFWGGSWKQGGALRGGVLGLILGHGGYFHPGFAFGPRFYLVAVPWLLASASTGLAVLSRWRGVPPGLGVPRLWVVTLPVVMLGYGAAAGDSYLRYCGVDTRPLEYVDSRIPEEGKLLVLIPALGYPDRPLMFCFHGRVDPFWEQRVVYLEDPGDPQEIQRLARLTGRIPWRPPDQGAPWAGKVVP
jgi:hypothetical protein